MIETLTVLFIFVIVALAATLVRGRSEDPDEEFIDEEAPEGAQLVREHPFLPWIAGIAVAAGLVFGLGVYLWVAATTGVVAGVGCAILIQYLASRKLSRFEFQLADSIDLMVSALRAGGGLTDALAGASREARLPLRGYLLELLDRIRLGERPEEVLTSLDRRVDLEGFRLFSLALAAHWEGGGSLATTLSNVGRTIRDRVDVTRRIRSQTVETQASVMGVLGVTYGLAWLMWNNYPDRFEDFATSELGSMFIGLSILLQGIGLFWISRMTRIEV